MSVEEARVVEFQMGCRFGIMHGPLVQPYVADSRESEAPIVYATVFFHRIKRTHPVFWYANLVTRADSKETSD